MPQAPWLAKAFHSAAMSSLFTSAFESSTVDPQACLAAVSGKCSETLRNQVNCSRSFGQATPDLCEESGGKLLYFEGVLQAWMHGKSTAGST